MDSQKKMQVVLQEAFNWSCKMTQQEYNVLIDNFRKNNININPHIERQLPLSFQLIAGSLEEAWIKLQRCVKRDSSTVIEDEIGRFHEQAQHHQ